MDSVEYINNMGVLNILFFTYPLRSISMVINTGMTGLQNLISLINSDNNVSSMTETNVSFSLPAIVAPDVLGRNTEVTVSPVDNMDFTGAPVTFMYRRLGLDQQVVSPNLTYAVVDSTTVASLKSTVCTALNLIPSEVDFVETVVARDPLDQGGTGFITQMNLAAKTESLVYVGTLAINCTWNPSDPEMSTVFGTQLLSGFNPVV